MKVCNIIMSEFAKLISIGLVGIENMVFCVESGYVHLRVQKAKGLL